MPELKTEVERDVYLISAGKYPDKGIDLTETDLDTLVKNFSKAPIKIEHNPQSVADGALGWLKSVHRTGKKLMGKLSIPADIWKGIESSGMKSVSISIMRDLSAIPEVSIVKNPRIAGAAIFSDCAQFSASIDESAKPDQEYVFFVMDKADVPTKAGQEISPERRKKLLSMGLIPLEEKTDKKITAVRGLK